MRALAMLGLIVMFRWWLLVAVVRERHQARASPSPSRPFAASRSGKLGGAGRGSAQAARLRSSIGTALEAHDACDALEPRTPHNAFKAYDRDVNFYTARELLMSSRESEQSFTTSEVGEQLGVSGSTVRRYITSGLLPEPGWTRQGLKKQRKYDLRWVENAKRTLREANS